MTSEFFLNIQCWQKLRGRACGLVYSESGLIVTAIRSAGQAYNSSFYDTAVWADCSQRISSLWGGQHDILVELCIISGKHLMENLNLEHRIQLRGPWECEEWPCTDELGPAGILAPSNTSMFRTVKLPLQNGIPINKESQVVVMSRRFHRPTNLGADQLLLNFEDLAWGAGITVNQYHILPLARGEKDIVTSGKESPTGEWYDVTQLVLASNILQVALPTFGENICLPFRSATLVICPQERDSRN